VLAATAGAAAIGWFVSPILATALLALLPLIYAVGSEGFERVPASRPPA